MASWLSFLSLRSISSSCLALVMVSLRSSMTLLYVSSLSKHSSLIWFKIYWLFYAVLANTSSLLFSRIAWLSLIVLYKDGKSDCKVDSSSSIFSYLILLSLAISCRRPSCLSAISFWRWISVSFLCCTSYVKNLSVSCTIISISYYLMIIISC